MQANKLFKKLLTGAISLSLVAPMVLSHTQPVNASRKLITITTNHDRLMFAKPGSYRYHYSNHNKGLQVINKGTLYYHHRLYYRVSVPEEHHKIGYVLASQTNGRKLKNRKMIKHHQRRLQRNNRHFKHQVKRGSHRQKSAHKKRSHRSNNNLKVQTPGESTSQWYTNNQQSPVNNLSQFNSQVKKESLKDINQDRAINHKSHLTSTKKFNRLADLRARQIAKDFSHFDGDHAYFVEDAKHFGINPNEISWGENISRTTSSSTPAIIADQLNDGYMHNDANSSWSHRKNILNRHWNHVSIGSYHDNQTNETYQSEIFTGK